MLSGSGAFFGALFMLSSLIADDAVRRLLEERGALVQVAGAFLEGRLRDELNHLGEAGRSALLDPEGECTEFRAAARKGFAEGAVLFDAEGNPRAASGGEPAALAGILRAGALLARVQAAHDVAVSELIRLEDRSVLVLGMELRGRRPGDTKDTLLGYVVGALRPEARALLEPLRLDQPAHPTELALVDLNGIVLASTDARRLFESVDHKGLLSKAILHRRPFRGRCHSCHEGSAEAPVERETEVLAFAPLPKLDLGLSVLEPESTALAPAFALRRHLWQMGGALIGLFMLFAALSVRSVVRPIRRLTRAVAQAEREHTSVEPAAFGQDEIGELARALDLWRGRMVESLSAAEHSRLALQAEGAAIRCHVEALRDISELSMREPELSTLVEQSLERALPAVGLTRGALRVTYRGRTSEAVRGFNPDEASRNLDHAEAQAAAEAPASKALPRSGGAPAAPTDPVGDEPLFRLLTRGAVPGAEPGAVPGATPGSEPESAPGSAPGATSGSERGATRGDPVLAASVSPVDGLRLSLVAGLDAGNDENDEGADSLAGTDGRTDRLALWLGALFRQICLCTSHILVRDAERERRQIRSSVLQKVLKAQEDERGRVARELHDTVAQDLAALRLELERLAGHEVDEAPRLRLQALESRAAAMLVTVRSILLDLRLSLLETMGLVPAMRWLLERTTREQGVPTHFMLDGDESTPIPYEVGVMLFRILQEGLLNAVQHAEPEHIFVTLSLDSEHIELTIEDDGRGFDPERLGQPHPGGPTRGLGLHGISERARILGGSLDIVSAAGEGATVRVRVPRTDTLPGEPTP